MQHNKSPTPLQIILPPQVTWSVNQDADGKYDESEAIRGPHGNKDIGAQLKCDLNRQNDELRQSH